MQLQDKNQEELIDLLIRLSSTLKDKDLEDPAMFGLVSQLVQILDPGPEPIPQEIVNELQQIADKAQRFLAAAQVLGVHKPEMMEKLAESLKAAGLLKSERMGILNKGAMQRLAPFNPNKVDPAKRSAVETWTTGHVDRSFRDKIPAMDPNERMRTLHKLSSKTQVRVNAMGEREFLLHRGMGEPEQRKTIQGKAVNHTDATSSWTPNLKSARDFAYDAHEYHTGSDGTGYQTPAVASAWINEKHIHFYPNQIGETQKGGTKAIPGKPKYHKEHEVIVAPNHKSELHAKEEFRDDDPDNDARPKSSEAFPATASKLTESPQDVHGRINQRAKREK